MRVGTLRSAAAVLAVAAVTVGCTGGSAPAPRASGAPGTGTPTASVTTAGSSASATPQGCPAPAVLTTAPTDFPHPTLTRHPPDPASEQADDALAAQGLAATSTFGGPIAATAFQHYLDATGSYLTLPVDGLLTATPALVTELDAALVAAAGDAVQQVLASPATSCVAVRFASDWAVYADLASGDWYATLGGFHHRVLGSVTRDPADPAAVRVTFRAAIGDTYDFDPGSTFAAFGSLALHGHAADFLDGGLTTAVTTTVRAAAELASPGFG